jgi:hypothetical protein
LTKVAAEDGFAKAFEEEEQADRGHEQDDLLLVDQRTQHDALCRHRQQNHEPDGKEDGHRDRENEIGHHNAATADDDDNNQIGRTQVLLEIAEADASGDQSKRHPELDLGRERLKHDQRQCGQHDEHALGEIEHARGLVDQGKSERDQRIHDAGHDAFEHHLQQIERLVDHPHEGLDKNEIYEVPNGFHLIAGPQVNAVPFSHESPRDRLR